MTPTAPGFLVGVGQERELNPFGKSPKSRLPYWSCECIIKDVELNRFAVDAAVARDCR